MKANGRGQRNPGGVVAGMTIENRASSDKKRQGFLTAAGSAMPTNNDGFMNPLLPPELQLKTLSLTET